jgi:hypothetical protein
MRSMIALSATAEVTTCELDNLKSANGLRLHLALALYAYSPVEWSGMHHWSLQTYVCYSRSPVDINQRRTSRMVIVSFTISIPTMGTIPITMERPSLFHPPLFVKLKIVSCTLPRGAMTHSGMTQTNIPKTCRTSTTASVSGRRTARNTLNRAQQMTMQIVKRV